MAVVVEKSVFNMRQLSVRHAMLAFLRELVRISWIEIRSMVYMSAELCCEFGLDHFLPPVAAPRPSAKLPPNFSQDFS